MTCREDTFSKKKALFTPLLLLLGCTKRRNKSDTTIRNVFLFWSKHETLTILELLKAKSFVANIRICSGVELEDSILILKKIIILPAATTSYNSSFSQLSLWFSFLSLARLFCLLVLILGCTLPCLCFNTIPSSPFVVLCHISLHSIVSPRSLSLFFPRRKVPPSFFRYLLGRIGTTRELFLDGGDDRWWWRRVV